MGFLKSLQNILFPSRPAGRYYNFQVKCKRCGEVLDGRVDLYNDPSLDYEGDTPIHFCRKVIIGAGPCYQAVETTFKFDENLNLLESNISGGEFVEGLRK